MGTTLFKTQMKKGPLNLISDVKGIKVGHVTLNQHSVQTGVTIILPREENIFKNKLVCASYVANGFGKTTGLIQVNELGTLESPIGLTNTLCVGRVSQGLIEYMLEDNEDIGNTTGTINVVVGECNDGYLNDIRHPHILESHVKEAIVNATACFEEGAVGAGRGMKCFGMKGGIGSASREIKFDGKTYYIGSLVLTNFGMKKDFLYHHLKPSDFDFTETEKGSVIIVLATDIPLEHRQLERICKRIPIALGRTGSYMGNGSGDIAIAFSTANTVTHYDQGAFFSHTILHEDYLDKVFRGAIDATEEAVLSSLVHAKTVKGRDGHIVYSLKDTLEMEK